MLKNFLILSFFFLNGWNHLYSETQDYGTDSILPGDPAASELSLVSEEPVTIIRAVPLSHQNSQSVSDTSTSIEEEENLDEEGGESGSGSQHLEYFKEFTSLYRAQSRVHFIETDSVISEWFGHSALKFVKTYLFVEVFRI